MTALSVHNANLTRQALQFIDVDDWSGAHELVQGENGTLFYLIHAYLHRAEGDLVNAAYWYKRAGAKLPELPLREELVRLKRMV